MPPSLSPIATSEPSGDGSNQSIATAASAARCAGRAAPAPARLGRRPSARSARTGRRRRPFEHEQPVAANGRATDRRQRRERGKALVPLAPGGPGFERLSGFVRCGRPPTPPPRPTHRPPATVRVGDGTPCSTSTIGTTRGVGGAGRTVGSATSHVGTLAVVRLGAAHARLLLLGLLRHGEPGYRRRSLVPRRSATRSCGNVNGAYARRSRCR